MLHPSDLSAPGDHPNSVSYDDGSTGSENRFEAWLGQPSAPIRHSQYDQYPVETLNFPEAYVGENLYLSQILITLISQSQQFPITDMLPYSNSMPGLVIQWDEIVFHDGILGIAPEQSVPRYVTTEFSSNSANMVRYNLGALQECNAMGTPRGNQIFANNIIQISNATVVTMCMGAIMACLNPAYYNLPARYRSQHFDSADEFEGRVKRGNLEWHIIAKDPDILIMLMGANEEIMRERIGKSGDILMVPPGTLRRLKMTHPTVAVLKSNDSGDLKARAAREGKCVVVEGQQYPVGVGEPMMNPLVSPRQISQFFQINEAFTRHLGPDVFRTDMLSTDIYDELTDNWKTIRYQDFIDRSGIFVSDTPSGAGGAPRPDAGSLTLLGQALFKGWSSWGQRMNDGPRERRVITRWMEFFRNPDFGLKRFQSFVATFKDNVRAESIAPDHTLDSASSWLSTGLGGPPPFPPPQPPGGGGGGGFPPPRPPGGGGGGGFPLLPPQPPRTHPEWLELWGRINAMDDGVWKIVAKNVISRLGGIYRSEEPVQSVKDWVATVIRRSNEMGVGDRLTGNPAVNRELFGLLPSSNTTAVPATITITTNATGARAQTGMDAGKVYEVRWIEKSGDATTLNTVEVAGDARSSIRISTSGQLSPVAFLTLRHLLSKATPQEKKTLDAGMGASVDTSDAIAAGSQPWMRAIKESKTGEAKASNLLEDLSTASALIGDELKNMPQNPQVSGAIRGWERDNEYKAGRVASSLPLIEAKGDDSRVTDSEIVRDNFTLVFSKFAILFESRKTDILGVFRMRCLRMKDLTIDQFWRIMVVLDAGCRTLSKLQEKNKDNALHVVTEMATTLVLQQLYDEGVSSGDKLSHVIETSAKRVAKGLWALDIGASERDCVSAATKAGLGMSHTMLDLFKQVRAQRAKRRKGQSNTKTLINLDMWDNPISDTGFMYTDGTDGNGDRIELVARAILYNIPIDGQLVKWACENNMPPIINLLGNRMPVYRMGTAIYMAGHGVAGITFQGQSNVMAQAGAQRKTFLIHYSTYIKSVVFDPLAIHHNMNVLCTGYIRGNSTKFVDPNNEDHIQAALGGIMEGDIIPIVLGPGEFIERQFFDLTGRYNPVHGDVESLSDPPHYSTHHIYKALFGWSHSVGSSNHIGSDAYNPGCTVRPTLTFQDAQYVWGNSGDRQPGQNLGKMIICAGPFGPNIYPGVGQTRSKHALVNIVDMRYGTRMPIGSS